MTGLGAAWVTVNHHQDVMQNLPNCSLGNFTLRKVNSLTPPLPSSFPNFSKSRFPTYPPHALSHFPTFSHNTFPLSRFPVGPLSVQVRFPVFLLCCFCALPLSTFPISTFPTSPPTYLPAYLLPLHSLTGIYNTSPLPHSTTHSSPTSPLLHFTIQNLKNSDFTGLTCENFWNSILKVDERGDVLDAVLVPGPRVRDLDHVEVPLVQLLVNIYRNWQHKIIRMGSRCGFQCCGSAFKNFRS